MDYDYEKLLEKAYEELPEKVKEHKRFEVPQVHSIIQGKVTVVQNLGEVAKLISRPPEMLVKYLLRELGTAGSLEGQYLIMKGQFRQPQIQEKFEAFLAQYVLCPECGRPDTRIIKEDRITLLKCEACGSRHPLGAIRSAPVQKRSTKPEVGEEITVQITQTGKRGDGVAKLGEYIIYVNGAREGQRVKARITGVQGTRIFATVIEVLR